MQRNHLLKQFIEFRHVFVQLSVDPCALILDPCEDQVLDPCALTVELCFQEQGTDRRRTRALSKAHEAARAMSPRHA